MIREIQKQDYEQFISLIDAFYHSPAVLHTVPVKNYDVTFKRCTEHDAFTACFVDEEGSVLRGYILLSFTYSNEVGGMVVWIEEVFVKESFRGRSIGTDLLRFVHEKYSSFAKRFRLEATRDNTQAIKLYESMGYKVLDYLQMTKDM